MIDIVDRLCVDHVAASVEQVRAELVADRHPVDRNAVQHALDQLVDAGVLDRLDAAPGEDGMPRTGYRPRADRSTASPPPGQIRVPGSDAPA